MSTRSKRTLTTSSEQIEPSSTEIAKTPSKDVMIRPLRIMRTEIFVRGTHPLIMHAWNPKAIEMMESKQQKKATGPRKAKDPEEEFQGARYKIDEKTDGIPAIAIKSCAVEAGTSLGLHKTDLRKSFFVCPDGEELVPIICPKGPEMKRDMVRVGMGTADVRYRPMYRNWSCKFTVEYNQDLISAEQLFNLFDHAGYSVGLGEWRPQKNGPFGRFRVAAE